MFEKQKQIPNSVDTRISSIDTVVIGRVQKVGDILDESSYIFEEIIDTDEHPAHFLYLYDSEELIGYLQFGYFSPNGYKPFYYISHLKNLSSRKGVGKRLMYEFLQSHSRIFLDDNAHIDGVRTEGYYQQFGFTQLTGTHIWSIGFNEYEQESIPLLYTRTLFGDMRREKREK